MARFFVLFVVLLAVLFGLELTPPGGELVVLPTYTAMLGLRGIVTRRGHVEPYWERAA